MENNDQFARALARLGDDKELFRELIGFFREDSPGLLAAIRAGVVADSGDRVARAAHSLRGLLANFDAEQAMSTAGSIEKTARGGNMQQVPKDLAELESQIRTLQSAMNGFESATPAHAVRR